MQSLTETLQRSLEPDASPEEIVRAYIMQGLCTGTLAPDQRLIEAELSLKLSLSRSYVRAAIKRLEAEGIVEIIQHRGARIRSYTPDEARNIHFVHASLIGLAAYQAAGRIGMGNYRERLVQAFEDLRAFGSDHGYLNYSLLRERFYRLLMEISGNVEIERLCPLVQGHLLRRLQWQDYGWKQHEERLQQYAAIRDAVLSGNGTEAEAAVWRSHEALGIKK